MQQRDLIQDQIEQLGKVLGKGIAKILGLDGDQDILKILEEVQTELAAEVDIDLKKLVGLSQVEYELALEEKLKAHEKPLNKLGELLLLMGKGCAPEGELKQLYLEKALWTYTYLDSISSIYSIERLQKIKTISDLIK